MRRCLLVLCSLISLVGACTRPNPPEPKPPEQQLVAVAAVAEDKDGPIAGAVCQDGDHVGQTNGDGYVDLGSFPPGQRMIVCKKPNYGDGNAVYNVVWPNPVIIKVSMVSLHFDPTTVSLKDVAAVRGAMWTARRNLAYGPRPNDASNILPLVFYDLYDPETRRGMLAQYRGQGYTHGVTGPVTGNDCYHSLYPCRIGVPTQPQWDAYLDSLQEQWDAHVIPCYFAKPDGWTLPGDSGRMDELDALYRQPRAQRLIRCVVYSGWEPSGERYGWNNAQYVRWVQRGAVVFPDAVRFLHTVSDLDAPTGQNDDVVLPPGQGNAVSWQNVAPYLHGWFDQLGGYIEGGTEEPSPQFISEMTKHVQRVRRGFHEGFGGWPTSSAWGDGQPLLHIVAEYAAYGDFWWNWDEKYAQYIGDKAIEAGADGYLDGGTVAVPR